MRGARQFLLVCILFTLLTVLVTWPVAHHLDTRLAGDGLDGCLMMWCLWWVDQALVDLGTSPYYTTRLYHPEGVTLLFQTLTPFNGLISIPLQRGFELVTTHNLIWLFSFAASGVGMYTWPAI